MPNSTEPVTEIRDVHKYSGTFCALNGISPIVRRGAIAGILGPSGSGKTTLIRISQEYYHPLRVRPGYLAGRCRIGKLPVR